MRCFAAFVGSLLLFSCFGPIDLTFDPEDPFPTPSAFSFITAKFKNYQEDPISGDTYAETESYDLTAYRQIWVRWTTKINLNLPDTVIDQYQTNLRVPNPMTSLYDTEIQSFYEDHDKQLPCFSPCYFEQTDSISFITQVTKVAGTHSTTSSIINFSIYGAKK